MFQKFDRPERVTVLARARRRRMVKMLAPALKSDRLLDVFTAISVLAAAQPDSVRTIEKLVERLAADRDIRSA